MKPVENQVIVITGGSSGIGLATAVAAAERGACVVIAARHAHGLEIAREKVESGGGQVITVAADVGHRIDVERIAETTVERFGRIDTWVNNAGRSIFGTLDDVIDEAHRELFETNFWGTVYGSLVAVEHLQKSGGALINLGSVASEVALPMQGMYSASKHAVRGFTDALRIEIQDRDLPISVTLIKPAGINTPFVEHSLNVTGREFRLPPPVYEPEEVAYAILHAAESPIREINVGGAGRMLEVLRQLWPAGSDWVGRNYLIPEQEGDRSVPIAATPAPNLGSVRGQHLGQVMQFSLYSRAVLNPMFTFGLAACVGLATAFAVSSSRRGLK